MKLTQEERAFVLELATDFLDTIDEIEPEDLVDFMQGTLDELASIEREDTTDYGDDNQDEQDEPRCII